MRNRGRVLRNSCVYLSPGLSLTACERLIEIDNEGSIELGLLDPDLALRFGMCASGAPQDPKSLCLDLMSAV